MKIELNITYLFVKLPKAISFRMGQKYLMR